MHIKPAAVIAQRRSRGLNQDDLADAMGVTERTIRRIESGLTPRPHPRTLKSLADALGVEVADIAHPDEEVEKSHEPA